MRSWRGLPWPPIDRPAGFDGCPEHPGLVESAGEALPVQPEPGQLHDAHQQPDQGLQDRDPTPERQNLPLEIGFLLLNDIDAEHVTRTPAEPTGHRGARDPGVGDDARIPGLPDQLSKTRIVGLLTAAL